MTSVSSYKSPYDNTRQRSVIIYNATLQLVRATNLAVEKQ